MSHTDLTLLDILKKHDDPAFLQAHSPHLTDLYQRHSDWLQGQLNKTPYDVIDELVAMVKSFPVDLPQDEVMRFLRDQKNRSSLVIALFDIFASAPTLDVTKMLSDVADSLVTMAFKSSVHYWVQRKKTSL